MRSRDFSAAVSRLTRNDMTGIGYSFLSFRGAEGAKSKDLK